LASRKLTHTGSWLVMALAILAANCMAGIAAQQPPAKINSLQPVIDDMTLPHEGRPHGVPASYDWAKGPKMALGNHPPAGWHAMTAWGQLYEDAKGNPARNTRVEIRNMRTYVLSRRDGRWRSVQSSKEVTGGAYREDFVDDINKKPDLRHEPDGGVSVTAGGGYNFHFWPPDGRAKIDPADIGGVFVTVEARLVVDNPSKPDDRSRARYLLSVGADYWVNRHANWDHFKTNDAVGVGRFKYVTERWQAFNFTTLKAHELRQNPPPLE
jgi:hypothetical protein